MPRYSLGNLAGTGNCCCAAVVRLSRGRLRNPGSGFTLTAEVLDVSDDEIAKKVKSMVAERMDVDDGQITGDTHFVNDLQADSLDMAELVIDMEEAFGVQISDEEAQKIDTVGKAIQYIQERKKG